VLVPSWVGWLLVVWNLSISFLFLWLLRRRRGPLSVSRVPVRATGAPGCSVDMVATRSYFKGMRSVGLKVLKNQLSKYVRLAEQVETVLVCDRDRVVAVLAPPGGRGPSVADALLADAVRSGYVTPSLIPPGPPPPAPPPVATLAALLAAIDADRAER
jgi:antitoxin (DNA-binding transcriptional repressor) of toxin-antitoxin stability system